MDKIVTTAAEAKEYADGGKQRAITQEVEDILKKITSKAAKGYYEMIYTPSVEVWCEHTVNIVKELEDKGFTVTCFDSDADCILNISWE